MKIPIISLIAAGIAMTLLLETAQAAVITEPFTAPIQSTGAGSDLADVLHANTASATWAVQGPGSPSNYYQYSSGATNGGSTAVWNASNLTGTTTTDWSQTTVFTINDPSSTTNIGLFALGNSTSSNGFVADVNGTAMRIIALGPGTSLTTGSFTGISLNTGAGNTGTVYTETFSGAYSNGGATLTLSFTLSDGTNSTTISAAASGLTLTAANSYWGIRNNAPSAATDTLGIRYSSFQIVPEPSTWGLLAFSAAIAFFIARRRCRSQRPC
jgi:hypothetical protein